MTDSLPTLPAATSGEQTPFVSSGTPVSRPGMSVLAVVAAAPAAAAITGVCVGHGPAPH